MTETSLPSRVRAAYPAVAAALCCLMPVGVQAHGALIEYKTVPGIALQAKYDNGELMTTAQITVYAPNNPDQPWLTGKGDKEGRFSFVPDPAITGAWKIMAREAGHGAMAHFMVGGKAAAADAGASAPAATAAPAAAVETTAQSPLQRWLMGASAVWGLIGTALFFARKKAG